ncbi:MAG TPA: glycosyltransferase family 39 protein [Pseudonocardiaceae bacterium]|nr:glycosyltransferase family 39 protein [Pseudonocardiaceae bacterium]
MTGDLPRARTPIAWRPVLIVLAVTAAIHGAVATRFGWHRDEFYYVVCGQHLAWGYPDQPPLTPLLARFAADLPGGVLPLRILAIAAELGCILLTAVLAAEFGGRARAQTIAAAATAVGPIFVAASLLFGTTVMDQLFWAATLVTVTRAMRLGTTRAWLLAGLVAGLGLENKDTIGVLLLGILIGLIVFHRPMLRTPGPWLAGGLALVILAPNLIWNATHDWAQLRMAASLSAKQGGPLGALVAIPLVFVTGAGALIVLWILGVRWLSSADGRPHRWVLVAGVTALVVFIATGGKEYYPAPALIGLFAAGGVWVQKRGSNRRPWPILIGVTAVLALVVGLPVLPLSAENALRSVDPEPVETFGWSAFAGQVTAVASTLPLGTTVFTSNYGEAGALTHYGPGDGLKQPVASGHNAYLLWGPPPGTTPDTVLCVGEFGPDYLRKFWSSVREIAPITMPDGVINQEVAKHAAIYLCQRPRGDWTTLWPGLRHLD